MEEDSKIRRVRNEIERWKEDLIKVIPNGGDKEYYFQEILHYYFRSIEGKEKLKTILQDSNIKKKVSLVYFSF